MDIIQTMKQNKESLMVLGSIAGFGASSFLSFKAGTKAHQILQNEKLENASKKEQIKKTYKCYIPPLISFSLSTALLCVATKSMNHKAAVAAAAATVLQTTATEIKEKTEEVIGEKKAKEVYDKIAQDKIDNSDSNIREVYIPGDKNYPVMESYLGVVFNSTTEEIKRVNNVINKILLDEGFVSFADLYKEFGWDPPKAADIIGWDSDICHGVEFIISDGHTSDGIPCCVISYDTIPIFLK